jgi:glyoxylase-like metal-dependent hydrolase (beta-lactamase superfamily II)
MAQHPSASYVSSRRFGEATVTVINDGTLPIPISSVFPPHEAEWIRAQGEADAQDRLMSDQAVIHVRIGDASILIDPAYDDPGSAWERTFAAQWPGVTRTPGMAAGLASIGVRPEEITHVLITHAHSDHFAGVVVERDGRHHVRFPNARHLIGRADWEGNPRRDNPDADISTRLGAVDARGLLDLVDGEREIVPGVTMIHAPGESKGHSIVRVESGGEQFYALGDLFHHASEIQNLDWASPWVDLPAMRASRDRFLAEAVPQGATVNFTHERFPMWGRIVAAENGYRWERT